MQTEKIILNRKKNRPKIPTRFFSSLRTEFFSMLGYYGYEIPNAEQSPDFEIFGKFWSEMVLHSMDSIRIETLKKNGWDIEDVSYHWPEKGLFIYGPCGSGKTRLARLLMSEFDSCFTTAERIINEYMAGGEKWFLEFLQENRNMPMIIDDFGCERDVKRYGNDSIMHDLVCEREEIRELHGVPTIFTSNYFSSNQIEERYGTRIKSRIVGMCDIVLLSGDDRRQKS